MESEYAPNHKHCASCVRSRCTVDLADPDCCAIVSCDLNCGFKFHACKRSEHALLCMAAKVACINYANGCPAKVCRSKVGVHLERCPASIVVCPGEWNRWPVYSQERKARVPFTQQNLHAKYGQLDVALALRDQRMLNDAMNMPRRVRQSLRNNLTQRFPAVPLAERRSTSESTSTGSFSDDDCDAPWETSKNPPGLQQSICGELFRASKKAADSLTATLGLITDQFNTLSSVDGSHRGCDGTWKEMPSKSSTCHKGDAMSNHSVHSESGQAEHYVSGFAASTTSDAVAVLREQMDADRQLIDHVKTSIPSPPREGLNLTLQEILALDLNLESITKYQAKPKSMYTFLCAQMFRRDEYASHFKNVHCDIHAGLNGWMECRCPLAHYGCTYSLRRFYPTHEGASVVFSNVLESFGVKPYVSPSLVSKQPRGTKEYVNCAMTNKQKEMTPEIVTSRNYDAAVQVNGTLRRASIPDTAEVTAGSGLHNETLPGDVSIFTSLPCEVLRCIAQCLDSYSLSSLALTCQLLRDVCCDLLEQRGIVVLQWERQMLAGRCHWTVTDKVCGDFAGLPSKEIAKVVHSIIDKGPLESSIIILFILYQSFVDTTVTSYQFLCHIYTF